MHDMIFANKGDMNEKRHDKDADRELKDPASTSGNASKEADEGLKVERGEDSRILPALIMDQELEWVLLVTVPMPHVKDLGIIEDLMVKTENFLIFRVHRRRHFENQPMEPGRSLVEQRNERSGMSPGVESVAVIHGALGLDGIGRRLKRELKPTSQGY